MIEIVKIHRQLGKNSTTIGKKFNKFVGNHEKI